MVIHLSSESALLVHIKAFVEKIPTEPECSSMLRMTAPLYPFCIFDSSPGKGRRTRGAWRLHLPCELSGVFLTACSAQVLPSLDLRQDGRATLQAASVKSCLHGLGVEAQEWGGYLNCCFL